MSMGPKAVELKRSFDEEEDQAYEDYLKDASMKSRSKYHHTILVCHVRANSNNKVLWCAISLLAVGNTVL